MNRDDITRLAREADVWVAGQEPYQTQLERFAALVAAAEREVCAKFLDSCADLKDLAGEPQMQSFCGTLLMGCAAAIRERGKT